MCTNVVNPNHKPATLEDLYHSKFGFVTSIAARLVEQELRVIMSWMVVGCDGNLMETLVITCFHRGRFQLHLPETVVGSNCRPRTMTARGVLNKFCSEGAASKIAL